MRTKPRLIHRVSPIGKRGWLQNQDLLIPLQNSLNKQVRVWEAPRRAVAVTCSICVHWCSNQVFGVINLSTLCCHRDLTMHDTIIPKSFINARWLMFSERPRKFWCNLHQKWDTLYVGKIKRTCRLRYRHLLRNGNCTACNEIHLIIWRYTRDVTPVEYSSKLFTLHFHASYGIILFKQWHSHWVAIRIQNFI